MIDYILIIPKGMECLGEKVCNIINVGIKNDAPPTPNNGQSEIVIVRLSEY
jgi:hypothetical protein